jgi:hypothetical protein
LFARNRALLRGSVGLTMGVARRASTAGFRLFLLAGAELACGAIGREKREAQRVVQRYMRTAWSQDGCRSAKWGRWLLTFKFGVWRGAVWNELRQACQQQLPARLGQAWYHTILMYINSGRSHCARSLIAPNVMYLVCTLLNKSQSSLFGT